MSSWQVYERLRAYFRDIRVYRHERLYADQHSMANIISGGEIMDLSTQSSLIQQTNLQINRMERYKDFDQMDQVGEIHNALDIYANEGSLIDPEKKHAILVRAKSNRVRDELEDLFYNTLRVDHNLQPWMRYLCKMGDCPLEIIPDKARDGVMALKPMNAYNFTRIETKYADLVGFFYQDEQSSKPTLLHPWQVAHIKIDSLENIYAPYGRSLLDGARKHFKQLRLLEDSAIVYRVTRAPEKRVFTIPVGQVPTHDIPQYIELIARQFKKKQFFDPASGDVNERWHPLIQEDDFWMPQREDGTGPTVDTLPGAQNLDEIADIEYFQKKMVSGLKIPHSRVGIGEADEGASEPLSKIAPEFAKQVQHIQQFMVNGLTKVAIVHLALRGYTADDIKSFDLQMTASSAIDELYRMEVWASRADTIEALKGTELFPDEWLLKNFTRMTEDEIRQMQEEKEKRDLEAIQAGIQLGGGLGVGDELGGLGGDLGGAGLPQLEGFDYETERLVMEAMAQSKHRKPRRKKLIKETYNSGFTKLLNEGELDHLPYDEVLLEDGSRSTVVIQPTISEDERSEVIKENERIIIESLTKMKSVEDYGEIKPSDLP